MGHLLIRLFGGLSVERDGERLSTGMGRSVGGLLAFLALHRSKLHHRESIAEVFWPDIGPDLARRSLNTTLWRLRRLVEPPPVRRGNDLVSTVRGEIGIANLDAVWIDIAEFESKIQIGIGKDRIISDDEDRNICEALELYKGDAFEGFYYDWATLERERLRCIYVEGLRAHMGFLSAQGDYAGAISCGSKILKHDPLQEFVHRDLIRLHLERGNRGLAARQFEACVEVLQTELGLQPEPATLSMNNTILTSRRENNLNDLMKIKEALADMRRYLDVAEKHVDDVLGSIRPDMQRRPQRG